MNATKVVKEGTKHLSIVSQGNPSRSSSFVNGVWNHYELLSSIVEKLGFVIVIIIMVIYAYIMKPEVKKELEDEEFDAEDEGMGIHFERYE